MISVLQRVYLLQWELQAVLRLPARWELNLLKKGNIKVNENMETTIPGLYAAGDCTGGLLQVAKAVYEGAQAGINAGKYVRSLK